MRFRVEDGIVRYVNETVSQPSYAAVNTLDYFHVSYTRKEAAVFRDLVHF